MEKGIIQTAAWIHIEEKRVLLSRNKGKTGFYMPGGKLYENEDRKTGVRREIKEELSIDLIESTIKHYGDFQAQAFGEPNGVLVNIACFTAEHSGKITPQGEIDEIMFFDYKKYFSMPEQAPAVRLILKKLHGDELID